ncbi:hypothetical protein [Helicobacter heilmannii]|uniref:Phage-Barnase-EndoU-ColicinE5/D-RelE-like nuclease domain-containing protein n=1 Tax=Helicobacter heilmannii TaxID=35817 RepID=A0A0K2Y4J4_HELHE|nr:hypothetical protein [Helicobacter heilmannii]CRI34051.1 hypothetical protein HHE01_17370 [Helicobacter heilmannii]
MEDPQEKLATQWGIITGAKDLNAPFKPQIPKDIEEALKPVFKKGLKLPPANDPSKWFVFAKDADLAYVKTTLESPDLVFDTGSSIGFLKRIEQWSGQDMDFLEVRFSRQGYIAIERNNALGLELAKQEYIPISKDQKALTAKEIRAWEKSKEEAEAKAIAEYEKQEAEKQARYEAWLAQEEAKNELPFIKPTDPINKSLGRNYPRYRNKGKEGLLALMYERTMLDGQIAHAYERPEIGGIDVWTQHYNIGVADSEFKEIRIYHDNLKLGLETFKNQPQEFLTPVGREAQIQAKRDFKKWRNTHLANAIDRTIKQGDFTRLDSNSIELSLREDYNGKTWDFKARIDWTNHNDPSQPKRWVLEKFKVTDIAEPPKNPPPKGDKPKNDKPPKTPKEDLPPQE